MFRMPLFWKLPDTINNQCHRSGCQNLTAGVVSKILCSALFVKQKWLYKNGEHFDIATSTTYRLRLPAPLTGSAYRLRLPAPLTGTAYRLRLPAPLTGTAYQHRLPTPLTSTAYQHRLPTPLTTVYQHRFPVPLTGTAYRHSLPAPLTGTAYRHRLPAPLTGTAYRHRLPAPLTGTAYRHRLPAPLTGTAYRHRLPAPLTGIAYQHRLPAPLTSINTVYSAMVAHTPNSHLRVKPGTGKKMFFYSTISSSFSGLVIYTSHLAVLLIPKPTGLFLEAFSQTVTTARRLLTHILQPLSTARYSLIQLSKLVVHS